MLQFLIKMLNIINNIKFQVGRSTISLTEIVQLIVFVVITFLIAKYLSHFLKHRGLKKIILDKGNRYIISNFVSYGTGFFLLLIVLQTTGFDISVLAVVGGGLGISIGLGLQDFMKNFISGLTLLTEHKIKTGDYIQIGDLRGFIQEISTRVIVVKKKDGSSVIIPNYQLVENQVINFHYETNAACLKLPVGVDYGSDTTLVTETLLLAAYSEHHVLQRPGPQVMFKGFEDSSLLFELWVWIENNQIGFQEEILSSLCFMVEYKLKQNNIHIPFPQLDLWIKNPNVLLDESNNAKMHNRRVSDRDNSHRHEDLVQLPEHQIKLVNNEPNISIRNSLKKVSAFSQLSELRLRQIIEIGSIKSLAINEVLFRENDPGDAFYIVLDGSVEVYAEKLQQQLAILQPGNFFGEMALMLGMNRSATVKALEPTLLFAIFNTKFKLMLQKYPDFHETIVQELSNHQEELIQRKQDLQRQGLLPLEEKDMNVLNWVRQRLQTLFSVS
jgi:small-conductance mechanosensitive channel/CRP-like cAMP-binding protein